MAYEHELTSRHEQWRDERGASFGVAAPITTLHPSRAPHANTLQPGPLRTAPQGLRLLAGEAQSSVVWDEWITSEQALQGMASLGLRVISLDCLGAADGHDELCGMAALAGGYDVALALQTPATTTALLQRLRLARRALRQDGTLVVTTTATASSAASRGDEELTLVGDESATPISQWELRALFSAEGFLVRRLTWLNAPTLVELAPVGRALPAPRRLLLIASPGDSDESTHLRLRSA